MLTLTKHINNHISPIDFVQVEVLDFFGSNHGFVCFRHLFYLVKIHYFSVEQQQHKIKILSLNSCRNSFPEMYLRLVNDVLNLTDCTNNKAISMIHLTLSKWWRTFASRNLSCLNQCFVVFSEWCSSKKTI